MPCWGTSSSATDAQADAPAFSASAWGAVGATIVPNSSIERMTAARGMAPTRICITVRWWPKTACWARILAIAELQGFGLSPNTEIDSRLRFGRLSVRARIVAAADPIGNRREGCARAPLL
jgi:hypothetical protein